MRIFKQSRLATEPTEIGIASAIEIVGSRSTETFSDSAAMPRSGGEVEQIILWNYKEPVDPWSLPKPDPFLSNTFGLNGSENTVIAAILHQFGGSVTITQRELENAEPNRLEFIRDDLGFFIVQLKGV